MYFWCPQVLLSTVEIQRLNGTWMLIKPGTLSWKLWLTCPTKGETPLLVLPFIYLIFCQWDQCHLCFRLEVHYITCISGWKNNTNFFITGLALNYILQNNFKENVGMRPNSRKIGVLITDGKSQDDVIVNSQNLRDEGIELYAIGE